jgi:DnaJ-related protein SCJ1
MNIILDVTLENLYKGVVIDAEVSKQILCDECNGSGAHRPEDIHTCSGCDGSGMMVRRMQLAPGMYQQIQQTCPQCDGKGKTITHTCPSCSGKKVRRGNEQYMVRVEKGMKDNQKIVSMRPFLSMKKRKRKRKTE